MPQADPDLNANDDFVRFMHAYQDMVFCTAARLLGNDAQAEDIAQEVFLKAYENFGQLQDSATRGGWLKTVATNLSLNHLSRYRKRWRLFSELQRDDAEDDAPVPDVEVPEGLYEGLALDERRRIVAAALRNLPEHQRVPLALYHFEERSYQEIADLLHVSLAKVKVDILRGRQALAKVLMEVRP